MNTLQQVFDYVATHLLTQDGRSYAESGSCAYRGEGGRSCAVGCLIKEEHYSSNLEGRPANDPCVRLAIKKSGVQLDEIRYVAALLTQLQVIHDSVPVVAWKARLTGLAQKAGLSPAVLHNFPDTCFGVSTMTLRTVDEIKARIKASTKEDMFGTQAVDLARCLPFEEAKTILTIPDTMTEADWEKDRVPATHDALTKVVREYLDFAWGKANDCRGLSAVRSVDHMKAWFWLMGYDDLVSQLDQVYEYYGKPCLVVCSELVGVDWKLLDNKEWVNGEDECSLDDKEVERVLDNARKVCKIGKYRVVN